MKHYLLHFAAVYSIALVLLITVLVFGLNLSGLALIPTLVACALISVGHFVKKEQRVPNNHEKIQLVWGSSAVAIIVGSFFVLFLVLMNPNAEAIMKSVDVKKSLDWFEQYGHRIVFFGRMIPAVRSLISIPAGMSRMPFWKFMFYSGLGTIIWTTFLATVGYYFGENQALMHQIFSKVGYVIIAIVAVIILWFLYRRHLRKTRS